jgi:hypothetical protein
MPLHQKRKSLLKLLGMVVTQSGEYPGDEEIKNRPVFGKTIPSDMPEGGESMLWLVDEAALQYRLCLRELLAEGEKGDLEHLAQRDIERALWHLVCETWLAKDASTPVQRKAKVDELISSIRRPPEEWEVLWVINDLTTERLFTIANVDIFPFEGELAERWMVPKEHPWRKIDSKLVGRTFARTKVPAGSKEKALERGKASIDDALNVLRVAFVPHVWLHDEQLLQRRGLDFYAGRTAEQQPTVRGRCENTIQYHSRSEEASVSIWTTGLAKWRSFSTSAFRPNCVSLCVEPCTGLDRA